MKRTKMADGIWLIKQNGGSRSLICREDELKDVEMLGAISKHHDAACQFIYLYGKREIEDSIQVDTEECRVSYTFVSASQFVNDLFKFLAMDDSEQKNWIKKLKSRSCKVHLEGDWGDPRYKIRDLDGRLIYSDGEVVSAHMDMASIKSHRDNLLDELAFLDSVLNKMNKTTEHKFLEVLGVKGRNDVEGLILDDFDLSPSQLEELRQTYPCVDNWSNYLEKIFDFIVGKRS